MTTKEAESKARELGLSVWVCQAIAVGKVSKTIDLYCVGFASLELPIAEAESWEDAFHALDQIIH